MEEDKNKIEDNNKDVVSNQEKTDISNNIETNDLRSLSNNVDNVESKESKISETVNNNEKNIKKGPSIIPSYEQKPDNNKNINNTKKNKGKSKKHISIIWGIIIAFVVLLIGGIIWFILSNDVDETKYVEYEEKMKIYGFYKMFDNSTLKLNEKVTKSEAVKMIVSSVYNMYDISGFASVDESKYDNYIWVNYALYNEFISNDYITEDNYNSKITKMDCINILGKVKTKYLGKTLDTDGIVNYKDFDKYSNEEQIYIKDMVYNGILDDSYEKANLYKNINKADLSKLIIKYVQKYNLITVEGEKLNINDEKLPANSYQYPYILASISKEIYQKPFYYADTANSILPVDLYKEQKENYIAIKYMIDYYFNTILNINYNTINKDEFKETLSIVLSYEVTDANVDEYIKYVKENKIVTSGTASTLFPIVYFDGKNVRVRAKISYKINSSNTRENIFWTDLKNPTKQIYDKDIEELYIDIPFTTIDETTALYIQAFSFKNWITGNVKSI